MRKYSILLLLLVLGFAAGYAKVNVIPEVSTILYDEDSLDLTGKPIVKTLIKNNSNLLIVAQNGEISRWDSVSKIKDFLYSLNRMVEADVFLQDKYLVLKEQTPGNVLESPSPFGTYIIFDLAQMKEIKVLKDIAIKKIAGIDQTCIVYVSSTEKPVLTVFDYIKDSVIKTVDMTEKETVFNGEWKESTLIVLSDTRLYTYDKNRNSIDSIVLKDKASSDFLMDKNRIYYGSEKRELIQFMLDSKKVRWSFKLGDTLSATPRKIGPYVAVVPRDNNIYFFNENGTLYWWEKLNSALALPTAVMEKNVVTCLWDGKIKFFDYKKKLAISYNLNLEFKTNPVCIGEYVYVLAIDKTKSTLDEKPPYQRLCKIGNYYGVQVKTEPEYAKAKGKSVRFQLSPINLIDPLYDIKIINNLKNQETVLNIKLTVKDKPQFIWIPTEDSEYRLIITIDAKNKKGVTTEQTFRVDDFNRIAFDYFYNIQAQCNEDSLQ